MTGEGVDLAIYPKAGLSQRHPYIILSLSKSQGVWP